MAVHTENPPTVPAQVLLAAVAQIDMALREAQGPVDSLGRTLERIAGELQQLRTGVPGNAALDDLGTDLGAAIQSLQFYDRMFQHLSHVHDFLADAADEADPEGAAQHPAHRWEALRERLFRRLLTDGQRDLLHALLPPQHWQDGIMSTNTTQRTVSGDIELF
jgi:hypothetical protein